MTTLQIIQALNAALALGVNGLATAQKIGRVLEQAQTEGRDISQEEWDDIIGEADAADAELSRAIEQAGNAGR